jgi:hypothetical protein
MTNKSMPVVPGDVIEVKSIYISYPTKEFILGSNVNTTGHKAVVLSIADAAMCKIVFFGTGADMYLSFEDIGCNHGPMYDCIVEDEMGTIIKTRRDGVLDVAYNYRGSWKVGRFASSKVTKTSVVRSKTGVLHSSRRKSQLLLLTNQPNIR